ncbi:MULTISPECIES: YciI family protein [Bombella]|uniref:YciI family protein n=1 Tax=Bombella saccharophila TaxID=2967338 RepID=A0ABT3WCL3_9PROT|nr:MULTISPECIES: YciI family protein [Bombella]MCT6855016.1 YciI family protein [Bombella apis]MCX5614696.1 YciI family protein [Bombella saccharophila]MUG04031.1 GTP cyclohydrolase [Bombella sp. ESL0378]
MIIAEVSYLASPEDVQAQRPAHRAFLDTLYDRRLLLASGPKTSKDGGILIIRDGISLDEIESLLAEDPFVTSGVGQYRFIEFTAAKTAPELKTLAQ